MMEKEDLIEEIKEYENEINCLNDNKKVCIIKSLGVGALLTIIVGAIGMRNAVPFINGMITVAKISIPVSLFVGCSIYHEYKERIKDINELINIDKHKLNVIDLGESNNLEHVIENEYEPCYVSSIELDRSRKISKVKKGDKYGKLL